MSLIENLCITDTGKPLLMDYLFESKFNIAKFQGKELCQLIGLGVYPLRTY
jgi:hypothetical protein